MEFKLFKCSLLLGKIEYSIRLYKKLFRIDKIEKRRGKWKTFRFNSNWRILFCVLQRALQRRASVSSTSRQDWSLPSSRARYARQKVCGSEQEDPMVLKNDLDPRGSHCRAVIIVAGTRVRRWQRNQPTRCPLVPEVRIVSSLGPPWMSTIWVLSEF